MCVCVCVRVYVMFVVVCVCYVRGWAVCVGALGWGGRVGVCVHVGVWVVSVLGLTRVWVVGAWV